MNVKKRDHPVIHLIKIFRYQLVLIGAIILGFIVVQSLLNNFIESEKEKHRIDLERVHNDAMLSAKAGVDVYASLVSSIRAYLLNSREFPTELELQNYLNDLIKDLQFNDSIVLSLVDTSHVFKYVVSPTQLDAPGLVGKKDSFRPESEIKKLDSLLQTDEIRIFEPINLREGWAGFPFNFAARNSKGDLVGYMAPILDVKYLLDYFYSENHSKEFVHSFQVNDTIDITREVVYDNTLIYNQRRDDHYYKNFEIPKDRFIYSKIDIFGLNLTVGSAYLHEPKVNRTIPLLTYVWYALLSIFSFAALVQYFRNKRLNRTLRHANRLIEHNNKELESNLKKIQTLIQEIHHRVKNNMQMVANLIDLEIDKESNPEIIKALKSSKSRIQSMALVHEKLYGSKNLQDIALMDYINQLISFIEQTVSHGTLNLEKNVVCPEDLYFDSETMESLGLIINELITNSFKHAFKEYQKNILDIEIRALDEQKYLLKYGDHGPGLPKDFEIETSDSLGMQLIYILTEQLNGEVEYKWIPNPEFNITFEKAKKTSL